MGKILRLKQGNIPHTGLGLTLCWFSVILFDSVLYTFWFSFIYFLIQRYSSWFSVILFDLVLYFFIQCYILLIHLQYHPPPTPTFTRQMPPHWTPTSCHVLRDWTPLSAPTVLVDYTVTDCTVWRKQTAPVSTRTKSSWYGTLLSLPPSFSFSLVHSLSPYLFLIRPLHNSISKSFVFFSSENGHCHNRHLWDLPVLQWRTPMCSEELPSLC